MSAVPGRIDTQNLGTLTRCEFWALLTVAFGALSLQQKIAVFNGAAEIGDRCFVTAQAAPNVGQQPLAEVGSDGTPALAGRFCEGWQALDARRQCRVQLIPQQVLCLQGRPCGERKPTRTYRLSWLRGAANPAARASCVVQFEPNRTLNRSDRSHHSSINLCESTQPWLERGDIKPRRWGRWRPAGGPARP